MGFEIALGAIGSALAVTNGVIIWICSDLKRDFAEFRESCRVRHDNVITYREYTPLENKVDSLHSRIVRHEAGHGIVAGVE